MMVMSMRVPGKSNVLTPWGKASIVMRSTSGASLAKAVTMMLVLFEFPGFNVILGGLNVAFRETKLGPPETNVIP